MKNRAILSILLLTLPLPVVAQPAPAPAAVPTPAAPPAPPARPAAVVSPEVAPGRRVTFRLKAPGAKAVAVRGQWSKEPLTLTMGENGVWSAEAGVLPAGIWEYSFTVDGLTMTDPGNSAVKPMREPRTSILHLAAEPPQPWDFQDVPHGAVHQHSYLSRAQQGPRELCVYTPPGYETSGAEKYPLLVLQHGSGDNQQTWTTHGKAHWILDSLIAAGKCRPMIVLMLDGHPLRRVSNQDPAARTRAMDAFRGELFDDALPLVEARYRVASGVENRGIVGLSMGGGQSLTTGLGHLDRFSWVGAFSGVPAADSVATALYADPAAANAKLRLLWIACGKDDFLLKRNEDFTGKLREHGINHEWHATAGDHSWPIWRGYLTEFLPRLFQPAKP